MKKLGLIIIFHLAVIVLSFGQATVQGTIKKTTGDFTVGVFLKPSGGNITGTIANFTFAISIPNLGPAPVPAVSSLPGVAINSLAPDIISGRHVFTYIVTGNVTGGINWTSGVEYQIFTAVFPNNAQTVLQTVQLNDYTADNGGNTGNAFFDILVQGMGVTNFEAMFYGTNAINNNSIGGNSSVEMAIPLPVTLVSFNAEKLQARSSKLSWSTANEINSSHFIVERSFDKKVWVGIGKVNAAGESQIIRNYNYIDENVYNGFDASMTAYYRLISVDLDGQSKGSPIESVLFGNSDITKNRQFLAYPNPASDGIHVEWNADIADQPTDIEFFDTNGKQVFSHKVGENSSQEYIDFTRSNMQSGLYLMRVMSGDEPIEFKQIVIGQR